MAFFIVAEQYLKTGLRCLLKIAPTLLVNEIDPISTVEYQCAVRQEPLAERTYVRLRVLHELSKANSRYLLSTVSAANKDVVDTYRLAWIGCLPYLLNGLERLVIRKSGKR